MWFKREPRIDDELRFHRDRLIDEYMAAGSSRAEAERQAFLEFGNVAATAEQVKDARGRWLDDLWRDIRGGLRILRKHRAFAATAAGTLALAIGTSTAMLSVLNAVVLRPLPYPSPEQLVMLWTEDPTQNLREGRSALGSVDAWRTQSRSFSGIATFDAVSTTWSAAEGAEQVAAVSISANLLSLLGIQPARGRSFSAGEAEQGQPLVLISHRFWQERFAGSNDAVGTTLVLNGRPHQIIGVLPVGFEVARLDADVWLSHPMSGGGAENTWFVVGRLRPAV